MSDQLYAVVVMFGPDEYAPDGDHPRFLGIVDNAEAAEAWARHAHDRRINQRGNVEVKKVNVYTAEDVSRHLEQGDE